MNESVLVISRDIRVIVSDDVPPGTAFLIDAALITERDEKTGELKHPRSAAKLENL